MAKDRVEIPPEFAARVLYDSDHTCCVCRLERTTVQIHHIDEDPSNNDFENLTVICHNCHGLAHTNIYFSRNYSGSELRLHNNGWRKLVRRKLNPQSDGVNAATLELRY